MSLSYLKHIKKQVEINKKLNISLVPGSKLATTLKEVSSSRRSTHSFSVLDVLLWYYRAHKGTVFTSLATLASHVGISEATASRCVKDLRQAGLINAYSFGYKKSFRYVLNQELFNPCYINEMKQYISIAHLAQVQSLIAPYSSYFSDKCKLFNIRYNVYYIIQREYERFLQHDPLARQGLKLLLEFFKKRLRNKKIYSPLKYLYVLLQDFNENYSVELPAHLLVSLLEKGITMNALKAYPAMASRVSGTLQRSQPLSPPVPAGPPMTRAQAEQAVSKIGDPGLREALLGFFSKRNLDCATVLPKPGELHEEDVCHQYSPDSMETSR